MSIAFGRPPAAWLWFIAVAGYGLLACVLTWPLPRHLRTHLPGDPGGDLGAYVWNMWVFRYELLNHGRLPISTEHLFAFSGGADFALHNYAPIAGLLGVTLIGPLGVVGAFNVLVLVFTGMSALGTFILARRLGLGAPASWAAGAVFAAAPALVARETAHFSLIIAAALPLFLWALLRTLDTQRIKDAAIVGVIVAVAYYSDAYYGIYCAIMGALVLVWRYGAVEWAERPTPRLWLTRSLDAIIVVFGLLIGWRLATGSRAISLGPISAQLETLYTPNLILLAAGALRAWLARRPVIRWNLTAPRLRALVRLGLVSVAVCLLMILPVLIGLAFRIADGRMPDTDLYWRSSPRGVDALAYLVPNPNNPWFGDITRSWFLPDKPDAFPEFIGAFSLVGFAVIALGATMGLLPRFWLVFTAFFFALSLGPFLHVAGTNTYLVGPWAFLRYIPLVGLARSPSRFAIVTALGLSILVAFVLDGLSRRRRAPGWLPALAAALLAVEMWPAPRALFSAEIPEVYRHIAAGNDEEGRLLELPTGIRDGTSSTGDFRASSVFYQTLHQRPLVGGYLSRVSRWRKRENLRAPMLRTLFAISEGAHPPRESLDAARSARDIFLRRSCVRFVLISKKRIASDLQMLVVDLLRLKQVYDDTEYALFTPIDPPACSRKRRKR